MDDTKIPAPFRIEHLCYLPMNLARTELVVRPCIALLHTTDPPAPTTAATASPGGPTVEESLMPRLDPKEVAAVFSAPLHNFLRAADEPALQQGKPLPAGKWYEGDWTHWNDEPWRVHYFYVPVNDQRVVKPRLRDGGLAAIAEVQADDDDDDDGGRYKVWGMTARIIVDAARIAYAETPEFEHNTHSGDERIILRLHDMGRMTPKKSSRDSSSNEGGGEEGKVGGKAEATKGGSNGGGADGPKM